LSVLAYAVLVEGLLFAGVVSAGVLILTYAVWQQGETERAFVVGVLGAVVAAAFWTARLEVIVPAAVLGLLVYLGWRATRGRRMAI
jgi:predicted negative regulator of RcsB-dependent stress response